MLPVLLPLSTSLLLPASPPALPQGGLRVPAARLATSSTFSPSLVLRATDPTHPPYL